MPAYTSHGWEIPGSVENHPKPENVAACGGPKDCSMCAKDAAQWAIPDTTFWIYDNTRHSEQTLFKVRDALEKSGMNENDALWAMIMMQDAEILFRERT
jgi:hypothetical protein